MLSFAVSVLTVESHAAFSQPRVLVENGEAEGRFNGGLRVFKGIPHAKSPVGELRWRSPQPVTRQNRLLRVYAYGSDCPQKGLGQQSEDCLYLNVWAPQAPGTYPVMVWIHGGGFTSGSGKIQGESLAKQGIVLVSINYRLGRLGSFAHPALLAEVPPGEPATNFWLLDQIVALKWVQRNIAQFGGDPQGVTIFGVSAGGTSVNVLMASPLAKGLLQRAISQSGINGYLPLPRLRQTYANTPSQVSLGERFAQKQRIPNTPDAAKALRNLPWRAIAQDPMGTGPVIDGLAIPDNLRQIFRAGKQQNVPFIVGANSYEGNLSLVIPWGEEPLKQLIRQNLSRLAPPYGSNVGDPSLWIDLYGDVFFRTRARYLAAQANGWHDEFNYVFQSLKPYSPGAGHGSEGPFVFGNLPKSPLRPGAALAKILGIPNRDYPIVPADYQLSRNMQNYWLNFARTGNPNGGGLPNWSRYAENNPGTPVSDQEGIRKCTTWIDAARFARSAFQSVFGRSE
jgi:para-nitrobenzyl esterase